MATKKMIARFRMSIQSAPVDARLLAEALAPPCEGIRASMRLNEIRYR
jgi:hypothetical protein